MSGYNIKRRCTDGFNASNLLKDFAAKDENQIYARRPNQPQNQFGFFKYTPPVCPRC